MSLSRLPSSIRRAALALGCCALIVPSAASADKIGDTPADFGKPVTAGAEDRRHARRLPGSLAVAPVRPEGRRHASRLPGRQPRPALRGSAHNPGRPARAHGRA